MAAKLAVTEAKTTAFKGLYAALGDKDGYKKLYRIVKTRERKARDLNQVKRIKDEDRKVLAYKTLIKQRLQAYFHKLLNEVSDRTVMVRDSEYSERNVDSGYCGCITIDNGCDLLVR